MSLKNVWDSRIILKILKSLGISTSPRKLLLSQYVQPVVGLNNVLDRKLNAFVTDVAVSGVGDVNPYRFSFDCWLVGVQIFRASGTWTWTDIWLEFAGDWMNLFEVLDVNHLVDWSVLFPVPLHVMVGDYLGFYVDSLVVAGVAELRGLYYEDF